MGLFVGKNGVNFYNTADVLWFRGPRLYVTSGAAAFTGEAVGLSRGLRLSVVSGAGAFTGKAVTFLRRGSFYIESGEGRFAGSTISLRKGSKLSIAAGAGIFTGKAVTLTFSGVVTARYTVTAVEKENAASARVRTRKEKVIALERAAKVKTPRDLVSGRKEKVIALERSTVVRG
jgi:hypothetical protein